MVAQINSDTICWRKAGARAGSSRVPQMARYIARNAPPAIIPHTTKTTLLMFYFGKRNCTCVRTCQLGPFVGLTTLQ